MMMEKRPQILPDPVLPAPKNREEAWRQDIDYLRCKFLEVDRSFTQETSKEFTIILDDLYEYIPLLSVLYQDA